MGLILIPKNKREEKVLKTFLNSLEIGFYFEEDEDSALLIAMMKGSTKALLNKAEKVAFLKQLKQAK